MFENRSTACADDKPAGNRLPFEVAEQIFRWCPDRSTLLACSIVCWNWNAPARSFSFRHCDLKKSHIIEQFITLIQNPSQTISPFIASIDVVIFDSTRPLFRALKEGAINLHLTSAAIRFNTQRAQLFLLTETLTSRADFPRLTSLRISVASGVTVDFRVELFNFVNRFQGLNELLLTAPPFKDESRKKKGPPKYHGMLSAKSLRKLSLHDFDDTATRAWVSAQKNMNLEELGIAEQHSHLYGYYHRFTEMDDIFRANAPTLLRLGLAGRYTLPVNPPIMFPRLITCYLKLYILHPFSVSDSLNGLCRNAPLLATMTIVSYEPPVVTRASVWENVRYLLGLDEGDGTKEHFPSLRSVFVTYNPDTTAPAQVGHIREAFSMKTPVKNSFEEEITVTVVSHLVKYKVLHPFHLFPKDMQLQNGDI